MIATSPLLSALFLLLAASAPSMASASVDIIFQDGFQIHYGFQVQTPDITVPAGQSATYCYYFDASSTSTLGIGRWVSSMQPGMMHLILYTTTVERQPAGTLSQTPCDFSGTGGDIATLAYAAYDQSDDLVFPKDDGTGSPLAIAIAAGQSAFLQMYVLNSSAQSLTTSAMLKAEALDPATTYTKTSTYVTYNSNIQIPPNAVNYEATQTCPVPANAKFWWLSTRTHKSAILASILDGSTNVVASTDWTHPSMAQFFAPNFIAFSSGHLTYQCVYDNTGDLSGSVITSGYSEATNENCIGIGYFFPALQGSFCYNNIIVQ